MRVLNNRLAALMDRARLLERLNAKMKVTLTKDVVDQRRVVRMEVGRVDYQEEKRRLEEKKAGLEEQVRKMSGGLERLRVENSDLRQSLKEAQTASKRSEVKVSKLRKQKEELRGNISLLSCSLTEAKGRLVRESQSLSEMEERLGVREEQVEMVKKEVERGKERLETRCREGLERDSALEREVREAYNKRVVGFREILNSEKEEKVIPSQLLELIQALRTQSNEEQDLVRLKYNSDFFDSLHVLHAMHLRERGLAVVSGMLLREAKEKEEVLGKKVAVLERTKSRLAKELKRREVELFEGGSRRNEELNDREARLREVLGQLEQQRKARTLLVEESTLLEIEIRIFKTLLDQAS